MRQLRVDAGSTMPNSSRMIFFDPKNHTYSLALNVLVLARQILAGQVVTMARFRDYTALKIDYLVSSNLCCKRLSRLVQPERMDKTVRKYAGVSQLDEIKADEYRYWQSRPVHERIDAVSELTQALYALQGEAPDVPRLQRTLVRFERAQR